MRVFGAIIILMLSVLVACDDQDKINNTTNPDFPPGYGILEFHFVMPKYSIPDKMVHRISLNLSSDVEALYRGEFLYKENVSDFKEIYKILLPVGSYYFDAVITCSCAGDTCLNGGFPGGQFGMKHAFDKFSIFDQEISTVKTVFQ